MARRKVPLRAGNYYHLYNRGVNRQAIFFSRENKIFFLRKLWQFLVNGQKQSSQTSEVSKTSEVTSDKKPEVLETSGFSKVAGNQSSEVSKTSELSQQVTGTRIIAYVFMPNHYHLLVQPQHDSLSHSMQLFGISYTKSINKRHHRVGPLFQGKFQAKHIDTDAYLLHLSRYIHLNPVEAGLVSRPEDWQFSSYRDYIGLRAGKLPCMDVVLSQFSTSTTSQSSEVLETSELSPDKKPEVLETSGFSKMADGQSSEVLETSELWQNRYRAFVDSYTKSNRAYIAHLLFEDD
ncbi:transposase [Anaerolineales bacterium HSG6]|nr:transposase [Anaerolineales bacterium HSG6]